MSKLRLNKSSIEKLPFSETGQTFYLDNTLPGFGLRVGKTKKSFYAEKRVDWKTVRMTIGTYPQVLPEAARKKAQEILGQMSAGINPIAQKKAKQTANVTLGKAFEDYMQARGKSLKPRTIENYQRTMRVAFQDWLLKEITKISKDMVTNRHGKLGEEQGISQANTHMRVLRAVFNFSSARYEDGTGNPLIPKNPVDALTDRRQWFKEKRKDRIIKDHQLGEWFDAVNQLESDRARDFFLLLLFTGLRKMEAAKLKWTDIDFRGNTFTITDTKNGKPLTLPLSRFTFKLLDQRKKNFGESPYVFPAEGKVGHFVNPADYAKKVINQCGVEFSVHDLRRTFVTVASRLVTAYELKMLVNHSSGGDVTHGYIIFDVENLRKPMQRTNDYLLRLCQGGHGKLIQLSVGNKMKNL